MKQPRHLNVYRPTPGHVKTVSKAVRKAAQTYPEHAGLLLKHFTGYNLLQKIDHPEWYILACGGPLGATTALAFARVVHPQYFKAYKPKTTVTYQVEKKESMLRLIWISVHDDARASNPNAPTDPDKKYASMALAAELEKIAARHPSVTRIEAFIPPHDEHAIRTAERFDFKRSRLETKSGELRFQKTITPAPTGK